MANCVSPHCRREIDPDWAFCPYCGKDNRPPEAQERVDYHKHWYLHDSGCCVKCGKPKDRRTRPRYDTTDDDAINRGCGCLGWILDFWWW